MGVYWEFFLKSFKDSFIYRTNFYLSLFSSILTIFILMSVWHALFAHHDEVNGITLADMIVFVIITFVLRTMIDSTAATEIGQRVNAGEVSMDLLKPLKFKQYMFSMDIGKRLFSFIFHAIPVGILAMIIWNFHLPTNPLFFLFFIISVVSGILLVFHLKYILGLTTFWSKTSFHVEWVYRGFYTLLAGTTVPLWFYPEFLYNLSQYFPFRLMLFEPIQIYMQKVSIQDAILIILLQFAWLIVLLIIEKVMWYFAKNKVVIHGG